MQHDKILFPSELVELMRTFSLYMTPWSYLDESHNIYWWITKGVFDTFLNECDKSTTFLSCKTRDPLLIVSQRLVKSRSKTKIWTLWFRPFVRVLSDSSCLQDCLPVQLPFLISGILSLPFAKQAVRWGPFIVFFPGVKKIPFPYSQDDDYQKAF